MPEWAAATPWWVVLGIAVAVAGGIFKVGKWVGAVNSDRKSFHNSVDSIKDDIREIRDDIKKVLHWQPSKTVESGSPLRLTELGRRVAEILDTSAIVDGLAPGLRARAEGKQAYDIQEMSFEFIRNEYRPSPEIDARIKQCACEHGLDRDEMLGVPAIELRDKLPSPA